MTKGVVTQAVAALKVLKEQGVVVPDDLSGEAVGDNIVELILDSIENISPEARDSDPGEDLRQMTSGRISVVPSWDENRLVGFDVAVQVNR